MLMNKIKTRFSIRAMLYGLLACSMMSCSDNLDIQIVEVKGQPYDPSKPIEVTDYSPKSGAAGQQMVVYGKNFGTDPSIIKVTVGGAEAVVISACGDAIYCLTPSKSETDEEPTFNPVEDEEEDAPVAQDTPEEGDEEEEEESSANSRSVWVAVGPQGAMQSAQAEAVFTYEPTWHVRTVVGTVNDKKEAEIKDGPFGDCGNIMNAATFAADPLNPLHIYVSSDLYTGGNTAGVGARSDVRLIDFEKKEVSTIFNVSHFGKNRLRDVKFTRDEEANMLIAIDDGTPSVILVKRKKNGDELLTGKEAFAGQPGLGLVYNTSQCNGVDVHPVTGTMFFNRYGDGSFHKFPDTDLNPDMTSIYDCLDYPADHNYHKAQKMFAHGETGLEMRVEIHPQGNYMLILQINGGSYIAKSMYNATYDTYGMMSAFIGRHSTAGGGSGYIDDVGTEAKTNSPRQIAWVKNPEYAGNTDEYDAYFTDRSNHCIRKITPTGVVSTFAGRGSGTGNPRGYADGLARGEALFDCPCGLYYNEERNVFWVGDTWNLRIREIYYE